MLAVKKSHLSPTCDGKYCPIYTMPGLGMNFLFFFLSTPEQRTIFTVKKDGTQYMVSEELDSELICLRNAELLAIQWP